MTFTTMILANLAGAMGVAAGFAWNESKWLATLAFIAAATLNIAAQQF